MTSSAPAPTVPGQRAGARRHSPTFVLLAALLVALFAFACRFIAASFWLDETRTVWNTAGGFSDVLHRLGLVPDSIPFAWLETAVVRTAGVSEIALRVPSMLAMAAALYAMFRLGAHLFDAESGVLAAIVLISLTRVRATTVEARPYAFVVLTSILSAWLFVRWLDRPTIRRAAAYAAAAVLPVYFSYFAVFQVVAQALALVARTRRAPRPGFSQAAAVFVSIALLLSPIVPVIAAAHSQSATHGIDAPVTVPALAGVLIPVGAVAAIAVAMIVIAATTKDRLGWSWPADAASTAVLVLWAAVPVAGIMVYSLVREPIFEPRYMMVSAPAICLLTAGAIAGLRPRAALPLTAFVLAAIVVFVMPPTRYPDDWRTAMAAVRVERATPDTSVLFVSRFVESRKVPMPVPREFEEFLLAPARVYPAGGPVVLMPRRIDALNADYVGGVVGRVRTADRFVLVGDAPPEYEITTHLVRVLGAEYDHRDAAVAGNVRVTVFARSRPPS